MKRILINASNLHVGGGVQVAVSFLFELSRLARSFTDCWFYIYASTTVDANLSFDDFDRSAFHDYSVFDIYGLQALSSDNVKKFRGFDLVFTVFGPLYLFERIPNHIVGFAQSWILYPNNEACVKFSLRSRLVLRFKFFLQWLFFREANRLVVELKHVKDGLVEVKSFPANRVDVVNNCVSSVFFDKTEWVPVVVDSSRKSNVIKLGYVCRDYPHKNIDFLCDVSECLSRNSSMEYQFFVTLTADEWRRKSVEFRNSVTNVGSLSVAQCPSFYDSMDAVIFPSLLESFSATPLEAMAMRRPLFASDRRFVHDCCGSNAIYFDPLDAQHAANEIDNWFCHLTHEHRSRHIDRAYSHLLSLSNGKDRALAYISIIEKQLKS